MQPAGGKYWKKWLWEIWPGGGGGVNEVHYGIGENGKFMVILIFVHVIIKLRIVNILKSVFSDNALNQ